MDENFSPSGGSQPEAVRPLAGATSFGEKPKYIVVIVLSLLAAGLVFLYIKMNQPKPEVFVPKQNQTQSLGATFLFSK